MFTGIVAALGTIRRLTGRGGDALLEVATALDLADVRIGDSIAVSGACLSVTALGDGGFTADVSAETLSRTTLKDARNGVPVNLEKALRVGDRLGGHIVLGHVDGMGKIVEKTARCPVDPLRGRDRCRFVPLCRREGIDHRGRRQPDGEPL